MHGSILLYDTTFRSKSYDLGLLTTGFIWMIKLQIYLPQVMNNEFTDDMPLYEVAHVQMWIYKTAKT